MTTIRRILIFHPAAIGDVMLATPVAAVLKLNCPEASIAHWSHESLHELLWLSEAIDTVIPYTAEIGLTGQLHTLRGAAADLVVDLAGSFKSWVLTTLSGKPALHYRKQRAAANMQMHAVNNFLATLKPLSLSPLAHVFPTLNPHDDLVTSCRSLINSGSNSRMLVGLVPGVGGHRPNRAWPLERWLELIMLIDRSGLDTVLIGGKDEKQLGEHLAAKAGSGCTNLCGRLSLAQTAAVLKSCNLVISGDTGPAHVAVAVGTPVLGIYGPTFPNRSGPYGPLNQVCDRSHQCRCHNLKRCKLLTTPGPGRCMQGITAGEVHTLAANLLATG